MGETETVGRQDQKMRAFAAVQSSPPVKEHPEQGENTESGKAGGTDRHVPRPFVMVCLSSSPSNKRVIRAAAKMAEGQKEAPVALYIKKTGREEIDDTRLRENIRYAREMGFEIHTVVGNDIAMSVSDYAKRASVTDIFLGYSPSSFFLQKKRPVYERLSDYLPTVDIHIIPDQTSSPFPNAIQQDSPGLSWNYHDFLRVIVIMTVATILALWFFHSRFSNSNIITIYILAVLIASVMTSSRIYGLIAAVLYVLLFNFLFIEPRFTLLVYDFSYLVTYLVTVAAALITGTVAVRMKNIARISAENAYQTKILLDTSKRLEMAEGNDAVVDTTCAQLVHLLRRTVLFCPVDTIACFFGTETSVANTAWSGTEMPAENAVQSRQGTPVPYTAPSGQNAAAGNTVLSGTEMPGANTGAGLYTEPGPYPLRVFPAGTNGTGDSEPSEEPLEEDLFTGMFRIAPDVFQEMIREKYSGNSDMEEEAIRWTMDNLHHSGACTSRYPDCVFRYLPVSTGRNLYGVIGIEMQGHPFTEFQNTILLSIVHECTMVLENTRMARERKEAEILAENERFRSGLLRSISHDLRTPLTSIYGNASNLHSYDGELPREERDKIYQDIMEDAGWLNEQFENILSMTKLESARSSQGYGLRKTTENIEDVIAESLRHIADHSRHTVLFEPPSDDLFAEIEPGLIMQVMINLLNNAIKYTPPGSTIRIRACKKEEQICVQVADNGPGIGNEDKKHIFELFYTASRPQNDSCRSMGIGLNLCAQILQAHGGTIEVADNDPAGTVFTFRLPAAEIPLL